MPTTNLMPAAAAATSATTSDGNMSTATPDQG